MENRRIERENRLGLSQKPVESLLQHPPNDYRSPLAPYHTPHSVSSRTNAGPSTSKMAPKRMEPSASISFLNPHRQGSQPKSKGQNPLLFFRTPGQHPSVSPKMTPHSFCRPPADIMGKNRPKIRRQEGIVTKSLRGEGRGKLQTSAIEKAKVGSNLAIKPVVRQALNLLCAEELQCRSSIINSAMSYFKDMGTRFNRLIELETIRAASLELLKLQAKCRAAVYDQEINERKFFMYWINQTLEEVKLKEIINEAQGTRKSMGSSLSPLPHQTPCFFDLRDTHRKQTNTVKKVPYSTHTNYNECHDDRESVPCDMTPRTPSQSGYIAFSPGHGIQSDDLSRKIGRQTHLMRDVLPECFSKTVISRPDAPLNDHWASRREYKDFGLCASTPHLSSPTSGRVREKREVSACGALFHDPFRTPLEKTPAQIKGESDLALKRRLTALLTV